MADIEQELQKFKSARYGEEVRDGLISAITKINENVESETASAKAYSESASASLDATNEAKERVEEINADLQSVVHSATQVMNSTIIAENARVQAENERVEAEQLREDTEQGYVAQAKEYMEQTKTYATSNYVTEAQSWAVGGTNMRAGEDTNNAKYWAGQAASIAGGNSVLSFNGRTGIIEPTSGDYSATQITFGDTNVGATLNSFQTNINSNNSDISKIKTSMYPVGSIITLANGVEPPSEFGEQWELIDKKFKNKTILSNVVTLNNTNVASISTQRAVITDDMVRLWFEFKSKVAYGESTLELMTLNYTNIGINPDNGGNMGVWGISPSDDGNGICMYYMRSSGVYESRDVVLKSTASTSTTIPASSTFNIEQVIVVPTDKKLDSFCNRFIYKRIA